MVPGSAAQPVPCRGRSAAVSQQNPTQSSKNPNPRVPWDSTMSADGLKWESQLPDYMGVGCSKGRHEAEVGRAGGRYRQLKQCSRAGTGDVEGTVSR